MIKKELESVICEQCNVTSKTAAMMIECVMDTIKESVTAGQAVTLRGFGTFQPKVRKGRKCRDLTRGTEIVTSDSRIPIFRPSREFKDSVRNGDVKYF